MPAVAALFQRASAQNTTTSPLQVICAFPVSGQYGAGSRILYYVLVLTCIFARKAEWLRNACLAAALVFPAVAAIHALVLTSLHINGAVDLDIYGSFQFCSIAILAAPLTVRLSRTYFYDPGRNIIFLWTILILAGLVALCVEFYRVTPVPCTHDNNGNPIFPSAAGFPYGDQQCGIKPCSQDDGPFSPLRRGATSEIFVIPAPTRLTPNAGMLLAAGFCVPAILSLVFTWDKILEINWKRRRQIEHLDEPVEGANVTVGELKGINNMVRKFLSVIEIPVFGGAVLAILGIGEANFFSRQLMYETEPIASIGQWAPIAGTVLAALGSLYLLWFKEDPDHDQLREEGTYVHSEPSQRGRTSTQNLSPSRVSQTGQRSGISFEDNALGIRSFSPTAMARIPTITHPDDDDEPPVDAPQMEEVHLPTAGRQKVRKWFTSAANHMGNAAHDRLDVSDFNDQRAHGFPEVPGETLRNPALERISAQYSQLRERNTTAGSTYTPSIRSTSGQEEESTSPQGSPRTEASPASPAQRPVRRDTLEVPTEIHIHRRNESK